jgi:hypothetical protein
VVTETRLLTLEQDGQDRVARLRDLGGRMRDLGWLDGAVTRAVLHIGSSGRSPLAVETAGAVAAALRAYVPDAHLEILDLAEPATERYGLPAITLDRDDTVVVRGPRGVAVHVPRLWFEPFFLVTVATVHPDRRWRIGGILPAQAEILARLNPGAPAGVLLAEAHRLGASDLAIACGTHPVTGDWWIASPSDVLVEGAVARAAGLDPRELPGIRAIARHELLASWEAEQTAPDLRGVATGAVAAAILAAQERSAAAGRRTFEDVGLVTRNLRKVPQALRRRLAARRSA